MGWDSRQFPKWGNIIQIDTWHIEDHFFYMRRRHQKELICMIYSFTGGVGGIYKQPEAKSSLL